MVKIWYSVFGEGMGHAMRSLPIIEHLSKKHKLLITAGDSAYPYLRKKLNENVYPIKSAHFFIENNEIIIWKTINNFLKTLPKDSSLNIRKIFNLIKRFKPDIIISDFEPASHYFANFFGIPLISIDNIHALTKCQIDVEDKYKPLLFASQSLVNIMHPPANHYIITTLCDMKKKEDNVDLFMPILRKEIFKANSSKSDFILVYQTSSTNIKLVEELKKINEKFVFYGMKKEVKEKNIQFKNFSADGFVNDFAKCKAVILNGGFTGISEALYLRKPMLIIPVKGQFEQIFNGMTIKKMGIGQWKEEVDSYTIKKFISKISVFEKNLKKVKKWDNSKLIERLDYLISKLKGRNKPFFHFILMAEELLRIKKTERTLTIIKPDGVEKRYIGTIISRFEKLGLKAVAMKMAKLNRGQIKRFYQHLKGEIPDSVFNSLINYMASNRVVLIVWQGKGVVEKVRKLCGPTNPKEAGKRHLRSLSNEDMIEKFKRGKAVKNIIHASANTNEAKKEVDFFFYPWEITQK